MNNSILDQLEDFVDPVFGDRLGPHDYSSLPNGSSADEYIGAFIAWLLHSDEQINLGRFLYQDLSSLGVWYPTINYRVLEHMIGKWNLGMAVLNYATVNDNGVSKSIGKFLTDYFEDEPDKGLSARVTFLCALILESITFPFEEVFKVVKSKFSDEVNDEWKKEKVALLTEWIDGPGLPHSPKDSGIVNISNKFREEFFQEDEIKANSYLVEPNQDGLKILLGLEENPTSDKYHIWYMLKTFMRDGNLSLASLDRILRLSNLLNIPGYPALSEPNHAEFVQQLISKLSLWYKNYINKSGALYNILDSFNEEWYIGVELKDSQEFQRILEKVNFFAEALHRITFSDERYITVVASLHKGIEDFFNREFEHFKEEYKSEASPNKQKLKDNLGQVEKELKQKSKCEFFHELFHFHTSQSLLRNLQRAKKDTASDQNNKPVRRWGGVLKEYSDIISFPAIYVWKAGTPKDKKISFFIPSDNKGISLGEDLRRKIRKNLKKEGFVDYDRYTSLVDLTELRLFWPNTHSTRKAIFERNVIAASFLRNDEITDEITSEASHTIRQKLYTATEKAIAEPKMHIRVRQQF